MNSVTIRKAEPRDYSAIIQLQNANTPERLSEEEKKQGFVVSAMTEKTIHFINENLGVLVAVENNQLSGFVCLASTHSLPDHPVVKAMYHTFPYQKFNGKLLTDFNIFIYGPVLIDPKYRGRGILKSLFNAVKKYTEHDYDLGAAFINDKNPHSLEVHVEGLGMSCLQPFESGDEKFQLVVFQV